MITAKQNMTYFRILNRRWLSMITAVSLVIFLLLGLPACGKRELKNVNVVLVVIDTVRSDHLPFYGYGKDTAPFLNELSKKCVVFDNAFAASSWTTPATASIFTSLYPFQHQALMGLLAIRMAKQIDPNLKINRIPDEIDTIAEVMKKAGYRTYGVADNLNIGEKQGFTQGFDKFVTFMYETAPAVNKQLKAWKEEITGPGKYFLYIHYMDPHAPYHPREPWFEPSEDRRKRLISAHDSEINFADMHLQEMFEHFAWDKNTLLIITSDHGEGLWAHGKMGHGNSLYREELQVPLMIYFPGSSQAKRIPELASTIDILPTVRDFIGLPRDKANEGISLMPLVEGRQGAGNFAKRELYPYLWKRVKTEVEFKSVLSQKWHFIIKPPKNKELFNLSVDKEEQHNLFFKGYKIAQPLEQALEAFMKECRKFKQQNEEFKMDQEGIKKLKSLGYITEK